MLLARILADDGSSLAQGALAKRFQQRTLILAGFAIYGGSDGRKERRPSRGCGSDAGLEKVRGKNIWTGKPGCDR